MQRGASHSSTDYASNIPEQREPGGLARRVLATLLATLCVVLTGSGHIELEHELLLLGVMPPALLTTPEYYGTLAAVRRLGRAGVRVAVAHSTSLGVAAFSRYVAERYGCPPTQDSASFIDWLCSHGKTRKPHVLCATSDDTVWLYARHRDRLSRYYKVSPNSVETIYALLNKRRLSELCQRVGIDTPKVWSPESDGDLARVAREAPFPLIIKPVTQILFESRSKGAVVRDRRELLERYPRFARQRYGQAVAAFDPEVSRPLLQEYFPEAAEGIYNLSGFIDESGSSLAVRASVKVLQHPRHLGVGLCFEDAPVSADLVEKIAALCREVGYTGVFEVEFIRAGGRVMMIDFNPRFYNQMVFDIARGLDLALLSYYSSLGDRASVAKVLDSARREPRQGPRAHLHRLNFEIMLRAQRLSGALSQLEERNWRRWHGLHGDRCTDAAHDPSDWLPGVLDAARNVYGYLRHPRAFVRTIVLNR
jgi:predicted ATP-grasp superfamily ATP-dependent carboligase